MPTETEKKLNKLSLAGVEIFDLPKIKQQYQDSKGNREIGKWIFAIATFGLGALYLWATTIVVKEGEIGLRQTARGKMVLLPPGRHSNFPWENYPASPQPLSKKNIKLGPYQIITTETGNIAKTFKQGKLVTLDAGQYLISDASHTFDGFISTKQETKQLRQIIASTSDNVGLTLDADVRYQIENPEEAVSKIDAIEKSIMEIAQISISQIVGTHCLADFAPAISAAQLANNGPENKGGDPLTNNGISNLVHELQKSITSQLEALGIKLINIGITGWKINDLSLAHELAQGAVVKSQTQSKLMAAKNAAEVNKIETEAANYTITTKAEAEATGITKKAEAYHLVAEKLKDNPTALAIYRQVLQNEMVSHAKSPYLFFAQNGQMPVVPTLPLAPAAVPA